MSEWKPIESAPKSGKWILVWWKGVTDVPFIAYWDVRRGRWHEPFGDDGYPDIAQPTHWMPLPAPPAEPTKGGASDEFAI